MGAATINIKKYMYVEMALELYNGRKNFEEQEKMPTVPWYTFGNTDVNISPSESSERIEKHGRKNIYDLRKYLNCHEQTGDRYVNFECTAGEAWMERRNMWLETRRKTILVYSGRKLKWIKSFSCLNEEISKKTVGVTCFFHAGYSKRGEQKDKLRENKNEKNAVKSP